MSTATTLLKLVALKDIEPELSWESFCSNPLLLFKAFAERFVVEAKFLDQLPLTIASDTVPDATDRSKLWIKTSVPYAIGIFADGQYQMDYGPSGLVPNQPFLALPSTFQIPIQGLGQMTTQEIANGGITDTLDTASVATRYRWYIFKPGAIAV